MHAQTKHGRTGTHHPTDKLIDATIWLEYLLLFVITL